MMTKSATACLAMLLASTFLTSTNAHAGTNLVMNGNFEQTSATQKTAISNGTLVSNWTVVTPGTLTFIDPPGTADNGQYLSVYKPFPATDTQQANGGNFIEADGDPKYGAGGVFQYVSGLIAGQLYMLTFDFAGSEQGGFTSPTGFTTEFWNVSLDTTKIQTAANTQRSAVLITPNKTYSPWQTATMYFTANAANEYLTFLAGGTPAGAPPIAFLDNVTLQVPEPMTLSLLGVGLLGTIAVSRRRRQASRAA